MKKFKTILILFVVLCLTVFAAFTPQSADAAYAVKQIMARFSCTAGEALVIGDVVAMKDSDGKCYKADSDVLLLRPAVGITGTIAASGASVEVITSGILSGWTSLAEGLPGYLSETAGAVTQTRPGWGQQVGYAVGTTSYAVNFQAPVNKAFILDTDNATLTAANCGETRAIATDAKVYTLPPTIKGCELTFVNGGAAGGNIITINPDDADQVWGTVTLAATVVVIAGAPGDSIANTKATSQKGDSITLVGDGADGWYIKASTGIWADTN